MLTDEELRILRNAGEADHIERTVSKNKNSKFGEAICAFSNDLPDRRQVGVLFVGMENDGSCGNITVDEHLLQILMGFRTDGTILPPPVISVRHVTLDGCSLGVVEVMPSVNPPVKYDGRVCIRIGPRRGYATQEEERMLIEKKRWGALPYDQHQVLGATIMDIDDNRFRSEFLPSAVHPDVISENGRTEEQQMKSLNVMGPDGPTVMGLIVCGRDPRAWLPGAYVQFVRYEGSGIGDEILDQREVTGPLADMLRYLDEIIAINITHRVKLGSSIQQNQASYPQVALRELIRNAVIHRNYEMTSSPVMVTWYSDRVEITSPGGPYGAVTAASFGQPGLTDARNPNLAAAAKQMGFVQRFGSGIPQANRALEQNGNPSLEFNIRPNFVNVIIRSVL